MTNTNYPDPVGTSLNTDPNRQPSGSVSSEVDPNAAAANQSSSVMPDAGQNVGQVSPQNFASSTQPYVPQKGGAINFIKISFLVLVAVIVAVGGYFGYNTFVANKDVGEPGSENITPTQATVLTPADSVEEQQNNSSDSANTVPLLAKGKNEEIVNFSSCSPGDGYSRSLEFGSTYLSIVEVDTVNDICKVEILNEVEGGYNKYSCNVPQSIGLTTFSLSETGSDFSTVMSYCAKTQSGSSLY